MMSVLLLLAFAVLARAAVPGQQGPFYFDQTVDHRNASTSGTFKQKYYTIVSLNPIAPVFLYISGEAPLGGFENDYVVQYARAFDATLVTLEHRFYGESLPLGPDTPFTVANLKGMLTVEQALADLANFITQFAAGRPVVTFGCSYAGALSAWFRVAYPDITLGSVSSSGVVNPILDFYQFDQQVAQSLGNTDPFCLSALRDTLNTVEAAVQEDPLFVMHQFQADGFGVSDFLYFMADAAAETVQYGYQSTLCSYVTRGGSALDQYAQFVNEFYSPVYMGGDVSSYSRKSLVQTSPSAGRAWWWQKCSELAYFQTAPSFGSLRSSQIDLQYYREFCGDVFDQNVFPNPSLVIQRYGGVRPNGTEIIFLQSSQDPWQRAGVDQTVNAFLPEYTVVCDSCGHCSDTRGCPSLPPIGMNSTDAGCQNMDHVKEARYMTTLAIEQWLGL